MGPRAHHARAGEALLKDGLRFYPEWRLTLCTVLLVPTMVALGFWQLQRAEEKSALDAVYSARDSEAPVPLDTVADAAVTTAADHAFRRVALVGTYQPQYTILLDNRIRSGRFGYDVVMPFVAGERLVLVNRGWIAGDPARIPLPEITTPDGLQPLTARIYVPPGEPYRLGEDRLGDQWPGVVQNLDPRAVAQAIGADVFPLELRLDPEAPGALLAEWAVVNQSPERHHGYALQWFAMAVVLSLFYVYRSCNIGAVLRGHRSGDSQP